LGLWTVGELAMLAYVWTDRKGRSWPLIVNYMVCGVICLTLLEMKRRWG
jgi:hypothetical protein